MNLDITPEVIITQLGIGKTDAIMDQVKNAIKNTKDFDKFSKHIISLNDKLKHMNAYVSLSNTKPYFKIKCDNIESQEIKKEFLDEITHWSDKYNVLLEKVQNKDVYYIIGR
jgi:hypothetical protein